MSPATRCAAPPIWPELPDAGPLSPQGYVHSGSAHRHRQFQLFGVIAIIVARTNDLCGYGLLYLLYYYKLFPHRARPML
jgi:hypothetical protein